MVKALIENQYFKRLAMVAPPVSKELVDSSVFRKVVESILENNPRTDANNKILEIVDLVCNYEMVDVSHTRTDAGNRAQASEVLLRAAAELKKYQAEALHVTRKKDVNINLSLMLKQIARLIRQPQSHRVSAVEIGKRGSAGFGKEESARRGAAIRTLDRLLPKTIENRYATIAHLLKIARDATSPQNVRGVLRRGKT